jgi:hypothetical protein
VLSPGWRAHTRPFVLCQIDTDLLHSPPPTNCLRNNEPALASERVSWRFISCIAMHLCWPWIPAQKLQARCAFVSALLSTFLCCS